MMGASPQTLVKYLPPVQDAGMTARRKAMELRYKQTGRYQRAKELVALGASLAQIERETGMDYRQVRKYFGYHGWEQGGSTRGQAVRNRNIEQELLASPRFEQAKSLVAERASLAEIERTTGISPDFIKKHLGYTGWTRREGYELRALNIRLEKQMKEVWGK